MLDENAIEHCNDFALDLVSVRSRRIDYAFGGPHNRTIKTKYFRDLDWYLNFAAAFPKPKLQKPGVRRISVGHFAQIHGSLVTQFACHLPYHSPPAQPQQLLRLGVKRGRP